MGGTKGLLTWLQTPRVLAHLLLLAVVFVWGSTFSLVKAALADASPLAFNLTRMLLASVVLVALNIRNLRGLSRRTWLSAGLAGLFLGLGYQLQTAGLARTTASKSAFITGLVVVFVPLLSAFPRLRPRGTPRPGLPVFAGALTAFAGLVLLTATSGASDSFLAEVVHGFGTGEILTLLCAFAFAAHLLTLSYAAQDGDARVLGTLQIVAAALLMLVTLPLGGRPMLHVTAQLIIALAVTALLGTAAAFTIQSWAQQHLSSTHTALILTLEPVFAWITALLFLHERLGRRELAGAGLILVGILLAELFPFTAASKGSQERSPTLA